MLDSVMFGEVSEVKCPNCHALSHPASLLLPGPEELPTLERWDTE